MEIKKLAVILILGLSIIGCSSKPIIKTRTETVTVERPILYCPAVDLTQLDRPDTLPITSNINDETPDGEVAVSYKASVKILLDYIERLELTLEEYGKFNKSYEDLTKELKEKTD